MSKVLTPGGHRDSAMVHRIPAGQKLCFDRDHYVLRDRHTGNPTKAVVPAALTPAAGGNPYWRAFASWTNDTGFPVKSMIAQFTVPDPPAQIGAQTIFLFPGIQNQTGNVGILQPVLQFGASAMGGGPIWAVASWYVPATGEAFHSDSLVPVDPGTRLTGRMTLTGAAGGLFNYSSQFDGVAGTECYVEGIDELIWCNVTLESYGVSATAEYPANGPTEFDGILIAAAASLSNLNWAVTPPAAFGESIKVLNASATSGEIGIAY